MVFFIPAAGVAAAATTSTFGGAALLAAATEVGLAMVSYPAILIGGGLTGYAIGKTIYDYLPPEAQLPQGFPVPIQLPDTPLTGRIRVAYRFKRASDPEAFTVRLDMDGPFRGISYRYTPNNEGGTEPYLTVKFFNGLGGEAGVFAGGESQLDVLQVLAITPLDGQTDFVPSASEYPKQKPGDYTPQWAQSYTPPGLPSAIVFHPEVMLQPLVGAPGSNPLKIDAPVIVAVPEAGQAYAFSMDGVSIIPYRPPENRVAPTATLTGIAFDRVAQKLTELCPCPEVPGLPDEESEKLQEILCRLKEMRPWVAEKDEELTVRSGGSGRGGFVTSSDGELVEARITTTPQISNPKKQGGSGGAPDVYYQGWFWWASGNRVSERIPLSALNNVFFAPKGSTGFAWTVYDGYTSTASYTTRELTDPPETC